MTSTLKDVLRYVSAEILLKGIGVVSLLYVGKLLNPEEFGYFSMALFVIALSTSLAEFGAASLILRDYHAMGSRCLKLWVDYC